MSTDSDAVSTARMVRASLDIAGLRWVKPFQVAYELDFDRVSSFFAGHPQQPGVWADTIARVRRLSRDHVAMATCLDAQLAARAAPAEARAGAARLGEAGTSAIVTGQQAGLFGGPFYTLLKAITAIQLARAVTAAEQVPVVPVFWVASEDHDWDEVRSTTVVTADDATVRVTAPDVEGAGLRPVGALTFDERIARTLADLDAALPRSTWTSDLLASLGRLYAPGGDPGTALAGWLDQLLGRHGLVVFDGADPCAKPLAASLFADELEHPERTAGLVRETGEKLRALGHPPQLVPAEHATALFYLDAHGRHPIRFARDAFVIGETRRTRADLVAEAHSHPERFSPNVMLRPVVQDCLFPTICYVAGPGELAYHAQLGGVYAACGVERPLLASRASATIVDAATARFLDRHDLSLDRLSASDDSVLNAIVRREIDPAVGRILDEAAQAIDGRLDAVRTVTTTVDPTLAATADTARRRVRQALDTLHDKIVRAVKRRDGTLRRQFTHARTTAFPNGSPQDRVLGVAAILNQYGPSLVDQLLEQLPTDARCHYVVVP